MSNSQLDLLLQLLEATDKSEGDAKVIHPLLEANRDNLDMNFAQVLRNWAMTTLPNLEIDAARNKVIDIINFSIRLWDFPLGNRAANLEIAITGYEIALTVFTRERFPYEWAMTQNNLGEAYRNRIKGEKADNLEVAIKCYQGALLEYTRERFPDEWATTQNNLGIAYNDRIKGERADNLEVAISCYQAALLERTRERFPDEWATTQNNLGNAYSNRIKGERADNLEVAISCYQAALLEYTRERFPYEWAMTQNNLGIAYSDRIKGERADNLELAITCYQAALLERTRERFPIQWATTQNNLGNTYSDRIKGERADNLEVAITCYQAALLEYTRDRFPIDWARTQNNLGAAYNERIKGERADNLQVAITCYQAALLEYTRDRFPIDWAMTQNNLGNAYLYRIKGERADNLQVAITCYQAALQVCTPKALPQNHAQTAFNLGLAYKYKKQFTDAYHIFQSAINTVEFLRGEIFSGDEIKQKLAEEWNKLYGSMVEVCLELKYDDQAVEYIERSKTRNLVELLGSGKAGEQRLDFARRPGAGSRGEKPSISSFPTEPIRFGEIQGLLDDHTAIVQWYIFNDCFRAFIITSKDAKPHIWESTASDLQDLDEWSDEYLESYQQDKNKDNNKDNNSWREQLADKLQELANILHINDVLDLVPSSCEALILVPHRYLHLFPLHALPLSPSSYLLDKFPGGVRYAPSCQLLNLAKKRQYQPQSSLFAIQDPKHDLEYSNVEVETIQSYFHPSKVLKQVEATKQVVLGTFSSLSAVQVVHFSSHAYFDINSPENSAIALADSISCVAPANQRYRELADGNNLNLEKSLTLIDIFNLNLPECCLVTLSACETGLTKYTTSDEYIGLPSGFLKAGSSSVVSSLWLVDDVPTALLMIRFYDNIYDNLRSFSIAEALCQAQQWLREATQSELIAWSQNHRRINEENQQIIEDYLKWYKSEETPFSNPVAWAGFCAIGH